MKSFFIGIVDIIMQKLSFFFLVVLPIAKRGEKKKEKKGMTLMRNLFLTLILTFNAITVLLFI